MQTLQEFLYKSRAESSYITSYVVDNKNEKIIVTEHCLLNASDKALLHRSLDSCPDKNQFDPLTSFKQFAQLNTLSASVSRLISPKPITEKYRPLYLSNPTSTSHYSFAVLAGFALAIGLAAVALAFTALFLMGPLSHVAMHNIALISFLGTVGVYGFFRRPEAYCSNSNSYYNTLSSTPNL